MIGAAAAGERVAELLARRTEANERWFEQAAEPLARLCHRMAERLARGGRLIAIGASPQARSDVRHVAVEFVHPVIVGKRALPALGLGPEGGPLVEQVRLTAEADDVVMGFGGDADTAAGLEVAGGIGCMTIGAGGGAAGRSPTELTSHAPLGIVPPRDTAAGAAPRVEWELNPGVEDPFVEQELVETAYHVLWELVHVFFEHRGLLEGRDAGPVHDTGASSFLYPFLAEGETDLESVLEDVRRSVLAKAREVGELRAQTLADCADELAAAATVVRARLDAGGKVLALGNGGSATDAIDLVADLRHPPARWPARAALDLTEDTAIITAVANDVGVEAIFQRQVIAYGREGDVLVALSTSGGSENVLAALTEARRRGIATLALVGYDGGRIAAERLADHVIVTRSEHIPRIQEAQASACHVLRELVERAPVTKEAA